MADSIPLWNIRPSRWQPRQSFDASALYDLAISINDHGLLNPPLVFAVENGAHELIAGERRTRAFTALALARIFPQHTLEEWAARLAAVGLVGMGDEERRALRGHTVFVPAQIRDGGDLEALHVLAVVENLEHADLSPLEEARAFKQLQETYGWRQRYLADRVNKSQSYVAQRLALLDTAPEVQAALITRVISATTARALAVVPEPLQAAVLERVLPSEEGGEAMTTREAEQLARSVATFVDPNRWDPNPAQYYEPEKRNALEFMASVVMHAEAVENVMKLAAQKRDPYGFNYLTAQIHELARHQIENIVTILRPGKGYAEQYAEWARNTGHTCENCALLPTVEPIVQVRTQLPNTQGAINEAPQPYCPRMREYPPAARLPFPGDHCHRFLSGDNAARWGIPITYQERGVLTERGCERKLAESPAEYQELYLEALTRALATISKKTQTDQVQHLVDIERYGVLSERAVVGWPNQCCMECLHYEGGRCRFAAEPLVERRYDGEKPVAPRMSVLISPEQRFALRCAAFAYRNPPRFASAGLTVGSDQRERVLRWLDAMLEHSVGLMNNGHNVVLSGPLGWLPWRKNITVKNNYNPRNLRSYLTDHWDRLGGDGAIACLLTAAANEMEALRSTERGIVVTKLYDPTRDAYIGAWSAYAMQNLYNINQHFLDGAKRDCDVAVAVFMRGLGVRE